MTLRLGVLLGLGFLGTFLACSSDDDTPAVTTTPDASVADTGSSQTADAGADTGSDTGATSGTWSYVPIDGAVCANGSPTGIGINVGTSKRLVIYMEGGGACWDEATCFKTSVGGQSYAQNLDGWDEAKFTARVALMNESHLSRTSANNPFKDDTFVYVPYCTGDVHAGNKVQTYPEHTMSFVGRKNMDAYLAKLTTQFGDASRVVLTGSSAGGFGAAINYWRVAKAFGSVRVDLVDDSGPPFPTDQMAYYPQWVPAWDLEGALPPDCAECAGGNIPKIMPYYAKTYPNSRFALLSYDQDGTISFFFNLQQNDFQYQLGLMNAATFDPNANTKYYEVAGTTHTMLRDLAAVSATPALATWLEDMVSDSASWASVKPAQE